MLLTAICSAELADVTAMKTSSIQATAPPLPRRATAASGKTKPAVTSASACVRGKLGMPNLFQERERQDPWL